MNRSLFYLLPAVAGLCACLVLAASWKSALRAAQAAVVSTLPATPRR